MQNSEKREHLFKVLVIGELGVGKTSFIKRYVHSFFSQNYRATIGVDFALKVLNWDQNTIIRLQLWDIAGKWQMRMLTVFIEKIFFPPKENRFLSGRGKSQKRVYD